MKMDLEKLIAHSNLRGSINKPLSGFLWMLLLGVFFCVSYTSFGQCEARFSMGSDSLMASETVACIPITGSQLTGVTSYGLGLTYDAANVSFRNATMTNGSSLDINTEAGNTTITWAGDPINLINGDQLLEICFDVASHKQEGYDINITGSGLPRGNQVFVDGEEKTLCTYSGRIETVCSIRDFRFLDRWRNPTTEYCRNDTIDTNYPFTQHPESDFPMTTETFKDGSEVPFVVTYNSNDFFSNAQNNPTPPSTYKFILTNKDGCVDSTTFKVLSIPDTTINIRSGIAWENPMITHTCKGINEGAIFVEPTFTLPDTGIWNDGEIQLGSVVGTHFKLDLAPGIYSIYKEVGGCRATRVAEVLDVPTYEVLPQIQFATCANNDGRILLDISPPGDYRIRWRGLPDTTATVSALAADTYIVDIEGSDGCMRTDTIILDKTEFISLTWESGVTFDDCANPSLASRTVSTTFSNADSILFTWSSGETTAGNSSTATNLLPGSNWVIASLGTCLSDTMHFEVTTPSPWELSIDSTNSNLAVCDGEQGMTTLLSSITDVTYSENGNPLIGNSFGLPIGVHIITATTSDGGCSQDIVVNISSNSSYYELQNQVAQELCLGQQDSSAIDFLSGPDIASILINQVTVDPADPVSFEIGANLLRINNVEGCTWDTTITITEQVLDISVPPDLTVTQGSDITITTEHDDSEPLLYTWMATNPWNCIVTDCRSIDYNPVESETIYLDVTNEAGCIYEDSIRITVIDTMTIDTMAIIDTIPDQDALFYIPNIVSANSITNNCFCIHYAEGAMAIEQFNLYDRWGNLIKNTPTSSQGRTCLLENVSPLKYNPGVYIYSIDILLSNGRRRKISGDVTIIN